MMSKKKAKREGKDVEPCNLVEVPVPADYPFGPILCKKEYEGVFKQLFPISSEAKALKEDKQTETI